MSEFNVEELNLESGESVLCHTYDIWNFDGEDEHNFDYLCLTNKNIIRVSEKSKMFGKAETIVQKIPLGAITKAAQVNDEEYGNGLRVYYKDGKSDLYELCDAPKKDYPKWANAINGVLDDVKSKGTKATSDTVINKTESANKYIFCSNCGAKHSVGAKFCQECGSPFNAIQSAEEPLTVMPVTPTSVEPVPQEQSNERKTVYAGELRKCPSCGDTLDSFVAICPTCGYEIRESKVASSVLVFASKMEHATAIEQRVSLIRNFPIPNNREDILEFMILASTNINDETQDEVLNAWAVKVEQGYQKAKILFEGTSDFTLIDSTYKKATEIINFEKKKSSTKKVMGIIVQNIAVFCGLIAFVIAVVMDTSGSNSAMVELLGTIALIATAATLPKRNASILDYAITAIGGVITIVLSRLLGNGAMLELCGGITLVIVAINFFRSKTSKK